jgi:hypothetical protein
MPLQKKSVVGVKVLQPHLHQLTTLHYARQIIPKSQNERDAPTQLLSFQPIATLSPRTASLCLPFNTNIHISYLLTFSRQA